MSTKAQRLTQIKAALAAELGVEPSSPLCVQIAAVTLAGESLVAGLLDERATISEVIEINNALRQNAAQLGELRALAPSKPLTVEVAYVDRLIGLCAECGHENEMPTDLVEREVAKRLAAALASAKVEAAVAAGDGAGGRLCPGTALNSPERAALRLVR